MMRGLESRVTVGAATNVATEGCMSVFSTALVQLILLLGLAAGAAVVFRNWRQTVPTGGGSDYEFAHHQKR